MKVAAGGDADADSADKERSGLADGNEHIWRTSLRYPTDRRTSSRERLLSAGGKDSAESSTSGDSSASA